MQRRPNGTGGSGISSHTLRQGGETVGRLELGEKLTPRMEIIDECKGEVNIRDDYVSCIVSWPIPEGKV
jgi:hypothetical protein